MQGPDTMYTDCLSAPLSLAQHSRTDPKLMVQSPVRYRAWARTVRTSVAMGSPCMVRLRVSFSASACLPMASNASHFSRSAVSTAGLCSLTALSACHWACLHSTTTHLPASLQLSVNTELYARITQKVVSQVSASYMGRICICLGGPSQSVTAWHAG